eukprot:s1943_g3.t1
MPSFWAWHISPDRLGAEDLRLDHGGHSKSFCSPSSILKSLTDRVQEEIQASPQLAMRDQDEVSSAWQILSGFTV